MPILSVIIPTHNRAKYLINSVERLLALGNRIEIVISDTSEDISVIGNFVKSIDRNNVKLINPGRNISVVDNFNAGLSIATGKYLLFLGDDDSVSDEIMNLLDWAEARSIDVINFTFPILYYWPDFIHRRSGSKMSGSLRVSNFTGTITKYNSRNKLHEALADLGGGVHDMPRAYSGIISRSIVEEIIKKYGSLFGGVSPDIYSSALISYVGFIGIKIDFPIVIPGISGGSTSGLSGNGKHVGKLRENPHIGAFKNLVWDNRVPEFYSVPTVWGYSLVKAMEKIDDANFRPDFTRLYAKCMIFHSNYFKEVWNSFNSYSNRYGYGVAFLGLLVGIKNEVSWIFSKIKVKLFSRFIKATALFFNDLPDIGNGVRCMEAYLLKTKSKIKYDDFSM